MLPTGIEIVVPDVAIEHGILMQMREVLQFRGECPSYVFSWSMFSLKRPHPKPYGLAFRGKNAVIPPGLGRAALRCRLAFCPFQRQNAPAVIQANFQAKEKAGLFVLKLRDGSHQKRAAVEALPDLGHVPKAMCPKGKALTECQ